MSEPTASEIADVIDAARDELLIEGRSAVWQDAYGICIVHAIGNVTRPGSWFTDSLRRRALDALNARVPAGRTNAVAWNFDATDDDIFDLFARTSKELREEDGAA
jgi:hypothetical protein